MQQLKKYIRHIRDFPKPGIQFKDITPLLQDAEALELAINALAEPFRASNITMVAGIEARGFIFGALMARELKVGFIPLRKAGKLPYRVNRLDYDLEYGTSTLEVHHDALTKQDLILLVDDLIATGGTAAASCQLIEQCGSKIVGCAFVIGLNKLRKHPLMHYPTHILLDYDE